MCDAEYCSLIVHIHTFCLCLILDRNDNVNSDRMGYNNPAFVDDDNSNKSSNTRTSTSNDDRQQPPSPLALQTTPTTNDVAHETTVNYLIGIFFSSRLILQ